MRAGLAQPCGAPQEACCHVPQRKLLPFLTAAWQPMLRVSLGAAHLRGHLVAGGGSHSIVAVLCLEQPIPLF